MTPKITGRSLALGAEHVPLHSGAIHYFRLKPSAWLPALTAMKRMGLGMIETYVPWGVHETLDGRFDWGQEDPSKDLGAFLDLVHSLGMYALVRPGPNINAELTYFGLPARIIYDESCQARSPRGNPVPFVAPPRMFPVPSYASERFLGETDAWFGEVARVMRPRLWPNGPIVMVQVDNEAAFYFRDAPYDQDYHPDAVSKFREQIRARYGSLHELSDAYEAEYAEWDTIDPPVRFESASRGELRRQLDWMRFQEELICGALVRMRESLRAHGLGALPMTHNLPLGEAGLPAMLARIDRDFDLVGLDYYHRRHELHAVRERTLRLVGSAQVAYSPEMGVGAPPWFAPRSDDDSLHTVLCACAYGVRGMNLYMAVDRDRWYGAPIDEDGNERPQAATFQRLFEAMARVNFHDLTRKTEVAIVLPKEYARLSRATHTLGAVSPTLLDLSGIGASAASLHDSLGFGRPIQLEWPELVARFAQALSYAGVPYVYIESDAGLARYADLKLVIAPSYEFAESDRWQLLHDLGVRGVRVLYGPELPTLDGALQPRAFSEPPNALRIMSFEQVDADDLVHRLVAEHGLARPFPCSPRSCGTAAHEDASGARVLFVVQPERTLCAAEIQLPEPMTLVDLLNDERYEGEASVTIPMPGCSCRMFACEPRSALAAESEPSTGTRSKPPSARRSSAPC